MSEPEKPAVSKPRLASELPRTASGSPTTQPFADLAKAFTAKELLRPHEEFIRQATIGASIDDLKASSLSNRMEKMLEELRGNSIASVAKEFKAADDMRLPELTKVPFTGPPRLPPNPVPGLLREQQETSALMLEALLAMQKAQEEAAINLQSATEERRATRIEDAKQRRREWRWTQVFVIATLVATLVSGFMPGWAKLLMDYFGL